MRFLNTSTWKVPVPGSLECEIGCAPSSLPYEPSLEVFIHPPACPPTRPPTGCPATRSSCHPPFNLTTTCIPAGAVYFTVRVLNADARELLLKRTQLLLQDSNGRMLRGLVGFLWRSPTMSIPARLVSDVVKMLLRHADCWPGPANGVAKLIRKKVHDFCFPTFP